MQLMANKKSPFLNGTTDEVLATESDSYVIQISADFFNKDGEFVFSATKAQKHYETILANILYTLKNGTEKQKKAAYRCLQNFRILPLRIQ